MLFVIEKQLGVYRQRIEELFARHPDHDLFGSLPGAGPEIAPRLMAEIGDERDRFDGDAQNLQCLGGTAPVTKSLSGLEVYAPLRGASTPLQTATLSPLIGGSPDNWGLRRTYLRSLVSIGSKGLYCLNAEVPI
jgi:Transposase IS116/IS110/IS902 family